MCSCTIYFIYLNHRLKCDQFSSFQVLSPSEAPVLLATAFAETLAQQLASTWWRPPDYMVVELSA